VRQSLRVVDVLEKEGAGLNLTYEVRDGILKHSKGQGPLWGDKDSELSTTLEGRIVRLADIIAYVNHDLDDALRAGLIESCQIPEAVSLVLGKSHSQRIHTMVKDLIEASLAAGGATICLSQSIAEMVVELRNWLFAHVYQARSVHEDFEKASRIVRELFGFYIKNETALVAHGGRRLQGDCLYVSVVDFIAGMTDRYAINLYHRLFLPQPWKLF